MSGKPLIQTFAQIAGLSPPPRLPTGSALARDLPHLFGTGVVPAKNFQAGTLAALSDRFFVVIQDTDALQRLSSQAA